MNDLNRDNTTYQAAKFYGKYPGIVVQNSKRNGEEKHLGEILVDISGILEETADGKGQQLLRVWAKPCFVPGFFFLPEVGASVWVEFAAGEINDPIWTGVWYPATAVPKTAADEKVNEEKKVIYAHISAEEKSHVIEIDASQNPKIVISDCNGNKLTMNNDGITMECCKLTVEGELQVSDGENNTTITGNEIRGS